MPSKTTYKLCNVTEMQQDNGLRSSQYIPIVGAHNIPIRVPHTRNITISWLMHLKLPHKKRIIQAISNTKLESNSHCTGGCCSPDQTLMRLYPPRNMQDDTSDIVTWTISLEKSTSCWYNSELCTVIEMRNNMPLLSIKSDCRLQSHSIFHSILGEVIGLITHIDATSD